mmetsp:Transcript_21313/g.48990  ORF Transcript_21313/g.48990 Transcript_21313/m.48990 type:complete len:952 (+) Transcript_21313:170-3025(+)
MRPGAQEGGALAASSGEVPPQGRYVSPPPPPQECEPRTATTINISNVVDEEVMTRRSTSSGRSPRTMASTTKVSTNKVLAARLKVLRLLDTEVYKGVSVVALVIALFAAILFLLFDVPDDPGILIQDALLVLAGCIFCGEILLRCFCEQLLYLKSPVFMMDLVGTVSIIFEISFFLGIEGKIVAGEGGAEAIVVRTARAAKVAARVGRLTRLMKCMSVVSGDVDHSTLQRRSLLHEQIIEAKALNRRLMSAVGTRVSLLAVALVIGIPLLSIGRYPEEDLSMKAWMSRLESEYRHSVQHLQYNTSIMETDLFSTIVVSFDDFYSEHAGMYFPYSLEGYPRELRLGAGRSVSIPGAELVRRATPARKQNVFRERVASCEVERPGCESGATATSFYDFTRSARFDAGMDLALMLFIVLCMIMETHSLSKTLNIMVVKPIERMQEHVRMLAKVLSIAGKLHPKHQEEFGSQDGRAGLTELRRMDGETEAELMEKVLGKLHKLTALFMESSVVSADEMVQLDSEAKGVLVEILGFEPIQASRTLTQSFCSYGEHRGFHEPMVTSLPVDVATIDSWDLALLPMVASDQMAVVLYLFFDSIVGTMTSRCRIDHDTFQSFSETVLAGYLENPYHNYSHACDVTATVYRMVTRLDCGEWLSDVELYSLMVSAYVHDIGHIGRTNNFLLETMHELAIRYNDKSPLENMHCAKLFEICNKAETNAFHFFNKEMSKHSRKVCITCILHTDNALHFDMVKDIKKVYEVSSDTCDAWASGRLDEEGHQKYKDVLSSNTMLWLKLILHMADISTPLKPFIVSKAWATLVQDEFFDQGDEEKELGLPVGMLNDRDKVSRSGSEHGFINFLVAPLVVATVGIFPELVELSENMARNMQEWRTLWVEEVHPSAEDIKKRDVDVSKVQEQVQELSKRQVQEELPMKSMTSGTTRSIALMSRASGRVARE